MDIMQVLLDICLDPESHDKGTSMLSVTISLSTVLNENVSSRLVIELFSLVLSQTLGYT